MPLVAAVYRDEAEVDNGRRGPKKLRAVVAWLLGAETLRPTRMNSGSLIGVRENQKGRQLPPLPPGP